MVGITRKVHADRINFGRMANLGSFSHEQYIQLDVHNPQSTYHNEFVIMVATNPVFHDSDFVILEGLPNLLEAAKSLYQNLESRNTELVRQNDSLREQHEALLNENSQLSKQCASQAAAINEIYGSNTWRIGSILRSIYRRVFPFRS